MILAVEEDSDEEHEGEERERNVTGEQGRKDPLANWLVYFILKWIEVFYVQFLDMIGKHPNQIVWVLNWLNAVEH